MRKVLTFVFWCFFVSLAAQAQMDTARIINEGIRLHDEGKYNEAIKRYDSILAVDKNHYQANFEKSYSLVMAGRQDECIQLCSFLVELDPKNPLTKGVYVNWGTAYDDKGDPENAVKVYDKGLKAFPEYYLLHFNRGITLATMGKPEAGLSAFIQALRYNPLHAGSHQSIGRLLNFDNRIPSIMAMLTFLLIEPESDRAKDNYETLNKLIMKGIKDNPDGKGTTISIDAGLLDKKNKNKENDFSMLEMMLSLAGATDKDEKYKDQDEAQKLDRKLQLMFGMMKEYQKDGKGFFWDFYAPFFIELKEKGYLLTVCYIANLNANSEKVNTWIKENGQKTDEFYDWMKDYKWKTGL